MKSKHARWPVALVLLAMVVNVMAQKQFTLEDLNFGGNNYRNMSPRNRNLTWWGDRLVWLDTDEAVIVDTTKDVDDTTRQVLVTTETVNRCIGADDSVKVFHLNNARFPYPDEPLILVKTNNERLLVDFEKDLTVWRQPCRDEQHADWNATSRAVAFVSNNQLCVTTADGIRHQLTTDGSREIVYGQSVHRNEFGITKGTFWSDDGRRLAFYRMDQSMVTDYPQVNTYTAIATYEPDKYPMAGGTSHRVTVGVYDIETQQTIYLATPDADDNGDSPYLTNIAWSPDGNTLYIQELNRDQNHMQLVAYDAATGTRQAVIYEERNDKYVEPLHPIAFLPWDAGSFVLQSQRDGYNHLYLCTLGSDLSITSMRQLTRGEFVVQELIAFNPADKTIIIRSNERSPIQSNIYKVSIDGAERTLLDNGQGTHRATASKDGSRLCDRYSEPDVPRNIDIINTTTAERHLVFSSPDPWEGYNLPQYNVGTIKAADDSTDLYYRIVLPVDFDPAKKYPAILYVYGGPHAHMIEAGWHYAARSWDTYIAQKGYIVFTLDSRGSENRGRQFEQATFRRLGQVEAEDQMRGVDYLLSLPYVDGDRLGVHGWSYGGYMTITLMTSYPDVFKVGVAGGPVIDWRWYEVMYGERYMDTPQTNPEGYAETSLLNKAANLKGKLQIIIGMNDDTVVPQHALQFIDACTEAGTQPDFFVYPGEGHNMMGHKSVHLHERITQYFEDYLK